MSKFLLPKAKIVWCAFFITLFLIPISGQAQTPYESLNYLYSIQGTRAIGGMHNRQPNANPNSYSQQLNNITGNWPGLYSADFQFEPNEIANRQTMVNQAITEWNNGAMINIMWHACNPALGEPCYWDGNGVLSSLDNNQWNDLITNGTQLNNSWKSRMDAIAYYLQQLEDAGVEVFFRPLHEMNQSMFWWGGRPGPNGTARLYQITHDYLTYEKGLSNLIWVWNLQDFSSLSSDLNSYDPGGQYWDVLTMDMYWSDGQGYTSAKYNAMSNKAGSKPMGIGECQDLPAVSLLAAQPKWSFFMGWSELTFQNNSNQKIQEIYWSDRVITLNEMPGWGNSGPINNNINLAYNRPVTVSSTESPNVASNAVDGDGNTRWSSQYANQQNFIIDLGANYNISRVRIAWEAAYGRDFQIQFSTNNSTWTTARSVWGNTSLENDMTDLSGTARYVKMYGITRATNYGFSMYEMEVYGSPATGGFSTSTKLKNNIDKIEQKEILTNAFPNPFTDKLTIRLIAEKSSTADLMMYDLLGNKIAEIQTAHLLEGSNEIVIDTKNWSPGVYTYILDFSGKRISSKLVKR